MKISEKVSPLEVMEMRDKLEETVKLAKYVKLRHGKLELSSGVWKGIPKINDPKQDSNSLYSSRILCVEWNVKDPFNIFWNRRASDYQGSEHFDKNWSQGHEHVTNELVDELHNYFYKWTYSIAKPIWEKQQIDRFIKSEIEGL